MQILATITLTAIVVTFCPNIVEAAEEEIVTINSRPGVTVSFIATRPDGPAKAAAILFSGGHGKLGLWQSLGTRAGNFLVRSRDLFAKLGILAATIDVPSDRRRNGFVDFRDTDEHRLDVAAVIEWLHGQTTAPVWLIGASRGTVSLSHVSGLLPIDGVIFSASVTEVGDRRAATALDGVLEKISVPVLLVHHTGDNCHVTPAGGVSTIVDRLIKSPKIDTMFFTGGTSPEGSECGANSQHGFVGLEQEVVRSMVRWMLTDGRRG